MTFIPTHVQQLVIIQWMDSCIPKEKEQTMNHKTIHRKLKTEQHEPYKKQEVNLGGKLIISFSTRCIPCVSLVTNLVISHE